MKLCAETDSKHEFIINAKLVESRDHTIKENMQKLSRK